MKKREISIDSLVLNNYTFEEVLDFCVNKLSPHMNEENLGSQLIYWEILEALNTKLNGKKQLSVI